MTANCKAAVRSMMKLSRITLRLAHRYSRQSRPVAAASHRAAARGDRRCAYQLAVTARRV